MSITPVVTLSARGHRYELGARPWLMGIVNATPDSFSDAGLHRTVDERVAVAATLMAAGADVIDIGGESASMRTPAVSVEEEIERVGALVSRVVGELGAVVSIDTYKPDVAAAAIAAGASIVNDVSGLRDVRLADVCAQSGAALVVMHTRAAPKQRVQDAERYDDVAADVEAFLADRIAVALSHGMDREQLIVDPGPDFAKTPAQSVELLAAVDGLHRFGRPVLMAISRKDFIGALTARSPRERGAGTLAALAHGLDAGAHIFRVHDVADAADFITVRGALRGEVAVPRDLALADRLRWESVSGSR